MSQETLEWLNNNTLIGFTDKRGNAWHRDISLISGGLDNHYAGAIPEADILSRLFNWTAEEKTLYVETELGMMPVDGKKALVRSDNGHVMGIHSAGYKGHPYGLWLVSNLSTLVGGRAQFGNAGLLKGGAVAWAQIETPDNIKTDGGVEFRSTILAGTSFDGSLASFFKPVLTNVVCDNTMAGAMGEATATYRMKHTSKSEFNLTDAQSALRIMDVTAEAAVKRIDTLTGIDVTDAQWSAFVEAHVPIKPDAKKNGISLAEGKRAALTGLWRTDVRVAPWQGTAWGVVQAVNTYNEHLAIIRNAERFERKMLRAISDDLATADSATIATLSNVMGRELLAV